MKGVCNLKCHTSGGEYEQDSYNQSVREAIVWGLFESREAENIIC